ncbi:copper chaperone PCu(A)C [Zavarzinia compransoris]|uniref:copper chaperone PCu(A)C n=1 Tax=Zavarzinia marina TaxID=2911065 RepID=UPI001F1E30FB|nr:copper chaperone PCu(A)C [Zavarzinia marina]MCF4165791.1 copper chaperone PCu(A)C [Zavarzinia marina]
MSNRILRFGRVAVAAVTLLASAGVALAHEYTLGALEIEHPWSRATPGGAKVGGGYLVIENDADAPDRLLSIESDIATTVQIHEMKMSADGMASMTEVEGGLEIPAKGRVELAPGGYHVMFMGLKHPLTEGESFDATLTFEKAGSIDVKFKIEAMGYKGEHAH